MLIGQFDHHQCYSNYPIGQLSDFTAPAVVSPSTINFKIDNTISVAMGELYVISDTPLCVTSCSCVVFNQLDL